VKRHLLRVGSGLGLLRPAYRAYERLLEARTGGPETVIDGLPVPPRPLMVRVAASADPVWFVESGRLAAESIGAVAPVREAKALLDFGCGCGRVVRQWRGLPAAIHGCDLDPAAIAWCRTNLGFAQFEVTGLQPPLPYAGESLDLVYALSVFTHLPEGLQLRWMAELARVLAAGGRLVLSTHGTSYRDRLHADELARFDAGEPVVRWEEGAGTNLCSAWHPPMYVRECLAAAGGLEYEAYAAEGALGNPHQDLHVFRRPA
jgi:SAM-dependent methyltransferase